jgi:hypothetical protein
MLVGEGTHIGDVGQHITHLTPISPVVEVYDPQTEEYLRRLYWYKHPKFIRRYAGEPALLGATYGSKEAPLRVPGYIAGEYEYIRKKLGSYRTTFQALLDVNGRMIDKIVVQTPDGKSHDFFFDVSGPMSQMATKLKAAWEEMKRENPSLHRFDITR